MIVRGTATTSSSKKAHKTYLRMIQNVQLTVFVPKMALVNNPIIEFSKEDARRLHHPHDDALVVSIWVRDYNIHRVLVDNGSSADIFYYPVFQQMRIDKGRLVSTNAPLVGFGGTKVYPLEAVTLLITIGDYPQQITKDVTFLVVNCSSTYNAILERPTFNSWKVVSSTYHLMIKFPIEYGVGEICGDQVAAHECYIVMLEMDDHLQAMNIEEQRIAVEPIERLEEIILDNSKPDRITRIGTLASPKVRQALTTFLKNNQDVFAWSHDDMLGIDPSVIVHRLNVSPFFPPIHQKKWVFTPKRDRAIAEEVHKLLEASFIEEVYYLDWLANVVMVKKAKGK